MTPSPMPDSGREAAPPGGLRPLHARAREVAAAIARGAQGSQPETPRTLVTIYNGGKMPTSAGDVFLGYETEIDAEDREGAIPSFTQDTNQSIPVIVLNQPASSGDRLVAHAVGGRWVAELAGSSKSQCLWYCGTFVVIDEPASVAIGFSTPAECPTAYATCEIDANGTITSLDLVRPGSCYSSNPKVKFVGAGTGAAATATVGEVTQIQVTDPGSGYDSANPPPVEIQKPVVPGSTQATAKAVVAPDGTIASIEITSGGSIYTVTNPTVTIGAPPNGKPAKATASAQPGIVTTLKLTAGGSGYNSNTPPDYLNYTMTAKGWSSSFRLMPGQLIYDTVNDLPIPYCSYKGSATVDLPAAGGCAAIQGVTLTATFVFSPALQEWLLGASLSLVGSTNPSNCQAQTPNPFTGQTISYVFLCSELAPPGTPSDGYGPVQHSAITNGAVQVPNCASPRPMSYTVTTPETLFLSDALQHSLYSPWYFAAGGDCPDILTWNGVGFEPNVYITQTVSEP